MGWWPGCPGSESPRPAPPPPSPLQTPPHAAASRLLEGGSPRIPCPRGAFSGTPAPSDSPIWTWPSPQDSQCASGQTYLLQPTTLGVLASPVTSNPSFLLPQSSSAASLQPLLRLACLLLPANGCPVYSLIAGSRESETPLWLPRATRDTGCRGPLGSPLGPRTPASARVEGREGGGAGCRLRVGGCGELEGGGARKCGKKQVFLANVEAQIPRRAIPL